MTAPAAPVSDLSPHDLAGHLQGMKCWRAAAGCGRRHLLAAACAFWVWCGTVGDHQVSLRARTRDSASHRGPLPVAFDTTRR